MTEHTTRQQAEQINELAKRLNDYMGRAMLYGPSDALRDTARRLELHAGELLAALTPAEQGGHIPWQRAEGHLPLPMGDCRKLVWLRDKDGMEWFGVRAYHHGEGVWYVGNVVESATVTHWADIHSPHYPPQVEPQERWSQTTNDFQDNL